LHLAHPVLYRCYCVVVPVDLADSRLRDGLSYETLPLHAFERLLFASLLPQLSSWPLPLLFVYAPLLLCASFLLSSLLASSSSLRLVPPQLSSWSFLLLLFYVLVLLLRDNLPPPFVFPRLPACDESLRLFS
jgi:hypothetical protein